MRALGQSKLILTGLAIAAIAGCSNPNDLFPLKVGSEWRYTARNQLGQFLHAVKVTREMPTAVGPGYELRGNMGDSVIAWQGNILKASVMAGSRFNPPIPLADGTKAEATLSWKGKVYAGGKTSDATAQVVQEQGEWSADMRRKATQTTLTLKAGEKTFKVVTIYVRGIGPVSQTQHVLTGTDQSFELSIDHLSGP